MRLKFFTTVSVFTLGNESVRTRSEPVTEPVTGAGDGFSRVPGFSRGADGQNPDVSSSMTTNGLTLLSATAASDGAIMHELLQILADSDGVTATAGQSCSLYASSRTGRQGGKPKGLAERSTDRRLNWIVVCPKNRLKRSNRGLVRFLDFASFRLTGHEWTEVSRQRN
jgi:hypothetical protein